MVNNEAWQKIFEDYNILRHDFNKAPFILSAEQIKRACQDFKETKEKEPRILCKQDSREDRPAIFQKYNLFILPIKNKYYNILEGEGYINIPSINNEVSLHTSILDFQLETSKIGNSEMQHLDFAYASSLIRFFSGDKTLVLTIRGRKYTPEFSFNIGKHLINVKGVQTEVDAGYEGKNKIVLVEAKNSKTSNVIIRQLYYPYRQWQSYTKKKVETYFFEKSRNVYSIWHFEFENRMHYNSIKLVKSEKFKINEQKDTGKTLFSTEA